MNEAYDLRSHVDLIDKEGELTHIKDEVDWNLEMGAIIDNAARTQRRPAVLFENIKGYRDFRFLSGTLNNFAKYALALGLAKQTSVFEIVREYRHRLSNLIKPKEVTDGVCQEVYMKDEEVDLFKFPTPLWHPGDGGRYFGTFHGTVTRDPETGWNNVGLYRHVIHDKRTLGIYWSSGAKHAWEMYRKYQKMAKPMPVAIVIGQDPVNVMAAFAPAESGVSEWDVAGGLRKSPVRLVQCKTNDLLVPDSAEIVIEGEIPPDQRLMEGPFGEFTGYYGGVEEMRPIVKVRAITHRRDPIHTGSIEAKPVIENHIMTTIQTSAFLERLLIDELRLGVREAYSHPASGMHTAIISMKQQYPGHAKRVAHAIWSSQVGTTCSHIIIVGEDIDPTNLEEVFWAVCTRCLPDRDITILKDERVSGLWPCLEPENREKRVGSKILIEATFPPTWPSEWIPKVADPKDWTSETYGKARMILQKSMDSSLEQI